MRNIAELVYNAIVKNKTQELESVISSSDYKFDINSAIDHGSITALHLAVKLGNEDQMNVLQLYGANVYLKTDDGDSCLHLAVRTGKIDVVIGFLNKIDVNDCNYARCSALHVAVQSIKRDIAKYLVDSGADINGQDAHGNTPLHEAVKRKSSSLIKMLLNSGSDPNLRNKFGNTPFHDSFPLNSEEMTNLFLERDSDVEISNNMGKNALHFAVIHSSYKTVHNLLQNDVNVNCATKMKETPLHLALKFARNDKNDKDLLDIVRSLMGSGANMNAVDSNNKTPLDYAIRSKKVNVVKYLLPLGATMSCSEKHRSIHEAVRDGDVESIRCILRRLDKCSHSGERQCLLYVAVSFIDEIKLRYRIVRFLLKNGEDARKRYPDRSTIIYSSITRKDLKLFNALVEFGAETDTKNKDRESPLSTAVRYGFSEAAKILIEKNSANGEFGDNAALLEIAKMGDFKTMEYYLDNGGVYDPSSGTGQLMLHEAVKRGKLDILKYLLVKGADVNHPYRAGIPLKIALIYYHPENQVNNVLIVDALVRHVALLAFQKLKVDSENMRLLKETERSKYELFEVCVDELARMRDTKVCDGFNVTYFDALMFKRHTDLIPYIRCKQVNDTLKSAEYRTLFPNYCDRIDYTYARAIDRLEKMTKFEAVIKDTLGTALPDCVIRLISEFYNDQYFRPCIRDRGNVVVVPAAK